MTHTLPVLLLFMLISIPLAAQQQPATADTVNEQGTPNDNQQRDRDLAVAGGLSVFAEDSLILSRPIADIELYDRAVLFRAIGSPILVTGVILTSLSAISWLSWAVSIFLTPVLTSLIGSGNRITQQFLALTAPLFAVSVTLAAIGGSSLVVGTVLKSLGNDYRERSFTALP